nr:MAG TPA: hypothetical protein [Caudoviricetes sp.]
MNLLHTNVSSGARRLIGQVCLTTALQITSQTFALTVSSHAVVLSFRLSSNSRTFTMTVFLLLEYFHNPR